MKATSRWYVFVGMALLAVSLIGATVLQQNDRDPTGSSATPPRTSVSPVASQGLIYQFGQVDVEAGLLPLFPQQPGAVTEVLALEGRDVKKGSPLLKVQDEIQVSAVAQAVLAVQLAETELSKAKRALDQADEMIHAQEAVVRAGDEKTTLLKEQLSFEEFKEKSMRTGDQVPRPEHIRMKQAEVRANQQLVAGEKARLEALRKGRPVTEVEAATRNVELKQKQREQFEESLRRCTLSAPQDGTILRVKAGVGTVYGSNPTEPAIIFAPAGERIVRVDVDQEFAGRINEGAACTIRDEANVGPSYTGKVYRISQAFMLSRNIMGPDVATPTGTNTRVLEVLVSIEPSKDPPPRLGQRMRVSISTATVTARATTGK